MSLAAAWNEQYQDNAKHDAVALSAWCAVEPTPDDWQAWLSGMPTTDTSWPRPLFAALGQDKDLWHDFLLGAAQSGAYKKNPMVLLDAMRIAPTETGSVREPLPLGCLEAMAQIAPVTSKEWKQQFLFRTPEYWFGSPQKIDPASTQPLHELGVALFRGCETPAKRIPSLAWSPQSLYDDYGSIPESAKPFAAPIQHALEYAVCVHQSAQQSPQGLPDPLAYAEVNDYFKRHNLSLSAFETLVDLSQASPTLGSYIRVLHAMMSPEQEEYHVDLANDPSQP